MLFVDFSFGVAMNNPSQQAQQPANVPSRLAAYAMEANASVYGEQQA